MYIEVKGWLIALVGIGIMVIGNAADTTLFIVMRWLGWVLVVIGCIYAMQIINILKHLTNRSSRDAEKRRAP